MGKLPLVTWVLIIVPGGLLILLSLINYWKYRKEE